MRSTTGGELTLLHLPQRSEGAKVEIVRSGVATNITSRVLEASINVSADDRVSIADLTIEDLYTEYATTSSLNPLVQGSTYNTVGAAYAPLIYPPNELKIYLGVNTLGTEVGAGELKLAFHGVLGSRIKPYMAQGKRRLDIHCEDLAKRLKDHFIVGEYVYGDDDGEAAVAVIQSILNDCFTWDTSGTTYKKLHVDATAYTNCSLVIYETKIGDCTCWDAINKVVGSAAGDDLGFELRYRFLPDGDTSTKDNEGNTITVSGDGFYLCLIQIDQSDTVADDSISVSTDEVHEENIEISDETVRNAMVGTYIDRDAEDKMEIHRESAASIATYGRRDMAIGQTDVPFIDTYEEMWDLLGVALNALEDVPGTDRFTTQMMYHVEPNDLLNMTNAQLFTGTDKLGVTDITHKFSPNGGKKTKQGFTTTFTGIRDKRVGSRIGFLSATGITDPGVMLPPSVTDGEATSRWQTDDQGNANTESILTVPVPPGIQYDAVQWRYAIRGDDAWREETTPGPQLVVMGLSPGKIVPWLHRFALAGGER